MRYAMGVDNAYAICVDAAMKSVPQMIDDAGGVRDVAEAMGLPLTTVASWQSRKSIPSSRWLSLVDVARQRGVQSVTLETLAEVHADPAKQEAGA